MCINFSSIKIEIFKLLKRKFNNLFVFINLNLIFSIFLYILFGKLRLYNKIVNKRKY